MGCGRASEPLSVEALSAYYRDSAHTIGTADDVLRRASTSKARVVRRRASSQDESGTRPIGRCQRSYRHGRRRSESECCNAEKVSNERRRANRPAAAIQALAAAERADADVLAAIDKRILQVKLDSLAEYQRLHPSAPVPCASELSWVRASSPRGPVATCAQCST